MPSNSSQLATRVELMRFRNWISTDKASRRVDWWAISRLTIPRSASPRSSAILRPKVKQLDAAALSSSKRMTGRAGSICSGLSSIARVSPLRRSSGIVSSRSASATGK
jgi:hypothetical protein